MAERRTFGCCFPSAMSGFAGPATDRGTFGPPAPPGALTGSADVPGSAKKRARGKKTDLTCGFAAEVTIVMIAENRHAGQHTLG